MIAEVALKAEAELGEGPTWDITTGTLLWVDVLRSEVHRFHPGRGTNDSTVVPQHVGAAKPRTRGGLVLNLRDGIALWDRDDSKRWLVYWARDGVRGNDAAVDPAGRLWAGTMRYDEARGGGWLARVEADGAAKVVLDDVTVSNGIGWSPDSSLMYYVDTPTRRIDVFDYDLGSGEAVNRREVCTVDGDGYPDGLCVDADGCIWVALWDGAAVRRYTPDGRLDRELALPVSRPTACCFGGDGFTDLYVTSARSDIPEETSGGSVFVFPDIGQGVPTPLFTG
ncbi:SMP-30/gluconolactonase/LRE family protein [Allokutzneria sp. A3M-2-11 16]|uniref:SMP-30/gluconolactonase/LRE family protein n=1 Tax=Allokutzneria sp. A3M-2-11 16 TaxID=2962043 RepID=UPI0020B86695|nr:SMP-30/gluconolactonase/LRE family protein [Allokutzneria sp. A3M-2-11 16]MCP3798295.1 SMP-30/gluconolactonase/LRE family protein [Allokutzneria sp. A3M-2-11 16]